MTRYKEYLRSAGIQLEIDYPYLPFDTGIETIETYFDTVKNFIVIKTYHISAGWIIIYVDKYGNLIDAETAEVLFKDEWQASK